MKPYSLKNHKKNLQCPLIDATVSFAIRDGKVLLAMKKRGFGMGKWNGVGGKRMDNEGIEETAIRETNEEVGITVTSHRKCAILDFYFCDAPEWGQRVSAFLIDSWEGDPVETEEMSPKWYSLSEIPYDQMWADDKYWLPVVLDQGQCVRGEFLFNRKGELLEYTVNQVDECELQ